jgi:hypothetical protein
MSTKETALLVHALGYAAVLIEPRKKKPSDDAWPERRPTAEEIARRFDNNPNMNVGVLLGEAGMDFECDGPDAEADLAELFADCEFPITPSWEARRGPHYWFAKDDRLFALGKAVIKYKSLEIRLGAGKAAQSLLPPSTTDGFTRKWKTELSATCLPAKLPDRVVDRIIAYQAQKETAKAPKVKPKTEAHFDSVGDDFNQRGIWGEILEPKSWSYLGENNGVGQWKRPGKAEGCSATTGFCKSTKEEDKFYCFSTNASPFEGGKSYSKFAVYTYLYHNGDFSAAAADLSAKGYGKQKKATISTALIDIAARAELFHTDAGDAYLTVPVGDHAETYAVDSRQCKRWVEHQYYKKTGCAPSSKAVHEALGVISARALFEGPEHPVFTRVGQHDGNLYVDSGNSAWEAFAIRPDGVTIEPKPPIKFRRPNGMLSLPHPQPGSIDELRPFVNVTDESWPMIPSMLVAALRIGVPCPIGLLISEHGSCKSTTMRCCRRVIDPNAADLRGAPDSVQTLMLAATNGLFVCIDNSSGVPPWLADALCRVSTGAGIGTRTLYTNGEESLFNVQRPVLVTGISELTRREDFLDRAVLIHSPEMPDKKRRDEASFYADYEKARPRILGALLHGASTALRNLPNVKLDKLPRMADFAKWAAAAETAWGWEQGTFITAYNRNRTEANETALDNCVADAVRAFLAKNPKWNGQAEPLLTLLNGEDFSTPEMREQEFWPHSGSSLSAKLNRMKPNLRKAGIAYNNHRRELSLSICV